MRIRRRASICGHGRRIAWSAAARPDPTLKFLPIRSGFQPPYFLLSLTSAWSPSVRTQWRRTI